MRFGIPGLEPCVVLDQNPAMTVYGCSYAVRCHVAEKLVRGRLEGLSEGLDEARFWLDEVACPGNHQALPDAPPNSDAASHCSR